VVQPIFLQECHEKIKSSPVDQASKILERAKRCHGCICELPPVNVLRKYLFFSIYYVAFIVVLINIEKY
jgi:hypothetical protein